MVLVALAAVVLVAITGLVIDSGRGYSAHRQAQNASDAAALAAAYRIYAGGTVTQAITDAQNVIVNNGLSSPGTASCGASPVSVCFYDGTGAATTSAGSVATVQVKLSTSVQNTFMKVVGQPITSILTSSKAEVHSGSSSSGGSTTSSSGSSLTCVICIQGPTQSQALEVQGTAGVFVNGGNVAVNSNAADGLGSGGTSVSTTPVLTVQGGGAIDVVGGYTGGSYSPKPATGSAPFSDPFAYLPEPTAGGSCSKGSTSCIVTGSSINTVDTSKNTTVNPGVYDDLTVSGSNSVLTLNAGIYVITKQFGSKATTTTCKTCSGGTTSSMLTGACSMPWEPGHTGTADVPEDASRAGVRGQVLATCATSSGGGTTYTFDSDTIDASAGVMLYFACPSTTAPFFTACTSSTGSQMGGVTIVSSTTFLMKPMTSAQNSTYAGMSMFFSRAGTLQPDLNGSSTDTIQGSIYGSNSRLELHGDASATTIDCVIDMNQAYITGNAGLTDNATAGNNAAMQWPAASSGGSGSPSGPPALIS